MSIGTVKGVHSLEIPAFEGLTYKNVTFRCSRLVMQMLII